MMKKNETQTMGETLIGCSCRKCMRLMIRPAKDALVVCEECSKKQAETGASAAGEAGDEAIACIVRGRTKGDRPLDLLNANARDAAGEAYTAVVDVLDMWQFASIGDDRAERLVDAIATFIMECNPEAIGQMNGPDFEPFLAVIYKAGELPAQLPAPAFAYRFAELRLAGEPRGESLPLEIDPDGRAGECFNVCELASPQMPADMNREPVPDGTAVYMSRSKIDGAPREYCFSYR